MQKIEALIQAGQYLLTNKYEQARHVITDNYPFKKLESTSRSYTDKQKMQQFKKDGFIDRYSGDKLVNPGFLKVLSHYMPEEFPYHSHWKMESCHNAYWEFVPTVDHIYPVALGGVDSEENWATISIYPNTHNTKIKTKGEPHVPKKHTENQMPGLWHRRRIYNMAEYQYEIKSTGEGGPFVWQVICVYLPEMQESPLY